MERRPKPVSADVVEREARDNDAVREPSLPAAEHSAPRLCAHDAFLDAVLDEPDLDAEQDQREFERLRWGLAQTETDE